MKKIIIFSLLSSVLGGVMALTALRFAPKVSLKYGLAIQKKVCPVFALQTQKYFKLKKDHKALKQKHWETKKVLDSLAPVQKQLAKAESFLKPDVSLRGSKESVIFQNYLAEKDGLKKAKTKNDLENLKKKKIVVQLRETDNLEIDSKQVKKANRYCLPRVKKFLDDMAGDFYEAFEDPLTVTSLFRSAEFQQKLRKRNANATKLLDCKGSVHSVGAAIDIKKRGLSKKELAWIRNYLLCYEKAGMIEATEEAIQPNFHIMVRTNYEKL